MAARTIKYDNNPELFNLMALANDAVSVAERQGKAFAKAQIRYALHHPKGGAHEAAKAAAEILTRSSDDTWSGRTNDIKRAYYDGMREVAGKVVRSWLRRETVTDEIIDQGW